jgi:hypothetical protein
MMEYTNQVAPGRAQTNLNDPNSKFETEDSASAVPIGIITGNLGFARRCDTMSVMFGSLDIEI